MKIPNFLNETLLKALGAVGKSIHDPNLETIPESNGQAHVRIAAVPNPTEVENGQEAQYYLLKIDNLNMKFFSEKQQDAWKTCFSVMKHFTKYAEPHEYIVDKLTKNDLSITWLVNSYEVPLMIIVLERILTNSGVQVEY